MDPISPATTTSGQNASAQGSARQITSDFETFLKMLTTQLQNQDPLSPLDSQEFAVQLATFSGVEQQAQTNELLKDLGGQLGLSTLTQLGDWVGQDVRTTAAVPFDGTPLNLVVDVPDLASRAELVVFDASGAEVQRLPIDPSGPTEFTWAGTGQDGAPLRDGAYRFEVQSTANGAPLAPQAVESFARVYEVRLDDGLPRLILDQGIELGTSDVTGLRAQ